MGSGNWYGVPNYGEYVMVYYNKDLFDEDGVKVPTTLDEMTAAMDTFVAKGITPLGMAGAEYPAGQLFYQLALSKADRSFVDDYQLYKNPVDFKADPLKYGADTFDEWVKKGYVAKDVGSLKAEDMGIAFIGGKAPMIVSGSWWYGRFKTEIKFNWDSFLFPGNTFQAGSSGNIWVVPETSKAKDLAVRLHRHHDAPGDPGPDRQQRRRPGRRRRVEDQGPEGQEADRELQHGHRRRTAWPSTRTGRCPATTTCSSPGSRA